MNTKYMKHYTISGENFASENDGETIIWFKDGKDIDITDLIASIDNLKNDMHKMFVEAEQEAEGYDPTDDLYEQSLDKY